MGARRGSIQVIEHPDSIGANVATDNERIANRDPSHRLPPGPWLPFLLITILWTFIALLNFVNPDPQLHWLGWGYLALAFFYPVIAWSVSVSWFELDSRALRVRLGSRSLIIPMSELVDVEAHRHLQSPFAKTKVPPYWLMIRRASGRPWRLQYIEPAAGDRFLTALYRLRKPIWVYN